MKRYVKEFAMDRIKSLEYAKEDIKQKAIERINKIAVITKPFEVGVELSAKQEMMRYRVADIYKEKLAKLYKD